MYQGSDIVCEPNKEIVIPASDGDVRIKRIDTTPVWESTVSVKLSNLVFNYQNEEIVISDGFFAKTPIFNFCAG